jgi:hypothetical protein
MLFMKYVLVGIGIAMIATTAAILIHDLRRGWHYQVDAARETPETLPPAPHLRWRVSPALALLAWGPILLALGIVVVASGTAG